MRRVLGGRPVFACAIAVALSWGVTSLATQAARAQDFRAPEAGVEQKTISVGGVERSYMIHIPPNVANPAPVVFVFHGGGGRPQAIARKTGMDELADQKGFVAIYPAGEPGPSGRGGTWNIGSTESVSDADDVAFVKAILQDVSRQVPIDASRIYATGHSMGGILAYRLACEMSDTFAAIAPVSATMVEPSCKPTSPVAVMHIHGAADDRIPLKGGAGDLTARGRSWPSPLKGVAEWSRLDQCAGETKRDREAGFATCTVYDQCRAEVEYCVIAGGGHPWPDDASSRIWAFFAAHPKPQAAQ